MTALILSISLSPSFLPRDRTAQDLSFGLAMGCFLPQLCPVCLVCRACRPTVWRELVRGIHSFLGLSLSAIARDGVASVRDVRR